MSQSDLYCHVDRKSELGLRESLALLTLPPNRRKRVLRKAANAVRRDSRQNLKQQKTSDGRPFAKRKTGKGKLLKKMGRQIRVRASDKAATLDYANGLTGQIAYRQHHGIGERYSARKMQQRWGKPDYQGPATRQQAKALLGAGYRIYAGKTNGRVRTRKPSQREIVASLTMGRAGFLLRGMTARQRVSSWMVTPEARPFLGTTPKRATQYLADALRDERRRT